MRNTNRLYEFYNELMKIHMENFPDWRFGQFIVNLERWLSVNEKVNGIFYIEEDELLLYINEFVDSLK